LSLIQAGFSCVVAESFARIFYRNSINIGLLVVECKTEIKEGDTVEVSVENGKVKDLDTGNEFDFPRYPPFITQLIESGGLINLIKEGKF
jgi:3-isopropylmalate dehydratase small subunit